MGKTPGCQDKVRRGPRAWRWPSGRNLVRRAAAALWCSLCILPARAEPLPLEIVGRVFSLDCNAAPRGSYIIFRSAASNSGFKEMYRYSEGVSAPDLQYSVAITRITQNTRAAGGFPGGVVSFEGKLGSGQEFQESLSWNPAAYIVNDRRVDGKPVIANRVLVANNQAIPTAMACARDSLAGRADAALSDSERVNVLYARAQAAQQQAERQRKVEELLVKADEDLRRGDDTSACEAARQATDLAAGTSRVASASATQRRLCEISERLSAQRAAQWEAEEARLRRMCQGTPRVTREAVESLARHGRTNPNNLTFVRLNYSGGGCKMTIYHPEGVATCDVRLNAQGIVVDSSYWSCR
jgi:hypothetical protein